MQPSEQSAKPEELQPPVVTAPPDLGELDRILRQQEELITQHPEYDFPQSDSRRMLYTKNLERVPFYIVSDPLFRTEPAKTVQQEDKVTGRVKTFTFDAHDCVQVTVMRVQIQEKALDAPRTAKFDQSYLVNQIRGLVDDRAQFLVGPYTVWTIRRNPKETTKGGENPYMLTPYVHSRDREDQIEPSLFDGPDPTDVYKTASQPMEQRQVVANEREAFAQWLFKELDARHEDYDQVAVHAGVERSQVNVWSRQQWEWYFKQVDKEAKLKERKAGSPLR